ncbi:MAG: multiheme c-type cytochrome [Planctomycetia bacterium]
MKPTILASRLITLCALAACGLPRHARAESPTVGDAGVKAAATGLPDRGEGVADGVVDTFRERNGKLFEGWVKPRAVVIVTGELDGYIEPCGCTGKENQKGGLSRRRNLLKAVAAAGWPLVTVDLGGQVKRFGRQSEIKFQSIADGLRTMGYAAVGFGPGDLRLPAEELVAAVAPVGDQPTPFVSANGGVRGLDAIITPRFRLVEAGGLACGIASILGDTEAGQVRNDAIEILPAADGLATAAAELKRAGCAHQILLSWASPEQTKTLAARFPQFDIVVTAGGADEPPAELPQLPGGARLIELGHKGMFAVALAFFDDTAKPFRSQRVPLDARWGEAEDMIKLLGTYQGQLESLGLGGLGIAAVRHPTGRRFAGSAACADCHRHAYDVWKDTPHATALATLEEQKPRRDGDPECLSCHVVGWAPQRFEPFEGGFAGMKVTPHLAHQGCENCHGPAAAHAAVERGDVRASVAERDKLRGEVRLSLDTPEGKQRAVNNCLECHDLDNSPQFDFDTYWPQVEHPTPAAEKTKGE